MAQIADTEQATGRVEEHYPVSVMLECRPAAVSRWVDQVWSAVGVTLGQAREDGDRTPRLVRKNGEVSHYLVGGLEVALHRDECESYYHNMMTATPRCYVVAHPNTKSDGMPEPFLVSMSFDEAHACLEGEEEVYAVDVPPELYRRTEAFVLAHYAPEKRTKRKRKDWTQSAQEGSES